jgi:hypothetical protein
MKKIMDQPKVIVAAMATKDGASTFWVTAIVLVTLYSLISH